MGSRTKAELSLRKVRSAITNGSSLVHDTDHRTAWMRRLKDLQSAHIADCSGEENISHSERVLINRASMLTLQLEMMEQAFASNDGVAGPREIDRYQRVVNTLRRTLEALGLQRRMKEVEGDTLEDIAAEIAAEEEGEAAEALPP